MAQRIALLGLYTVLISHYSKASSILIRSQLQPTSPTPKFVTEIPSSQVLGTGLMSAVKCISGSSNEGDVLDVPYDYTQFLVNISSNFQYLQISLKIVSCSPYDIYRGNRFLTRDVLHLSSPKMQTVMKVAYSRQDGAHAYTLSLDSINFSDTISTSIKCGEFSGFRVKAKGASVCDLRLKENNLGVRVGMLKAQPRDASKNLHDLHRWTQGAYVMAICFTLTSYLLFLLAMRILRSHTQYEFVVSESNAPVTEISLP